jgi:hypothetical protein
MILLYTNMLTWGLLTLAIICIAVVVVFNSKNFWMEARLRNFLIGLGALAFVAAVFLYFIDGSKTTTINKPTVSGNYDNEILVLTEAINKTRNEVTLPQIEKLQSGNQGQNGMSQFSSDSMLIEYEKMDQMLQARARILAENDEKYKNGLLNEEELANLLSAIKADLNSISQQ